MGLEEIICENCENYHYMYEEPPEGLHQMFIEEYKLYLSTIPCYNCKHNFRLKDNYSEGLKSCPLCGNVDIHLGNDDKGEYFIRCSECGCKIEGYADHREAINLWNKRP